MMKPFHPVLLLALPLLISCGGGGDQAGAPTAFSVDPTSITVTGPKDSCPGDPSGSVFAARVFVYGGTAPYKLGNTAPDAIILSKSQVDHPGDSFDVSIVSGYCMDTIPVSVVDATNHVINVTVSAKKGT